MELNIRSKKIRLDIIELSSQNGGYHYGGSFSCVEILLALYDHVLKKEDKFIMSKGHGCWGFYVLLREKGLKPLLEGHPHRDEINGVYWTTGSEGHGFPAAVGAALARKIKKKTGEIFVLLGDGECQEGTTWESFLIASHKKLDNLTVIVDFNGIQGSGFVKDILPLDCLGAVAEAIGWKVTEIDGHDMDSLKKNLVIPKKIPHLIIAKTIKGKGVSFMENQPKWHANWLNSEFMAKAIEELK